VADASELGQGRPEAELLFQMFNGSSEEEWRVALVVSPNSKTPRVGKNPIEVCFMKVDPQNKLALDASRRDIEE
jgi:hypothetical protein